MSLGQSWNLKVLKVEKYFKENFREDFLPKMKYVSSLFLVALVVATSTTTNGAAVKPKAVPRMKFLGEFQKPTATMTARREGRTNIMTSYYFLSQNSAGYAAAENDCKASLGPDSTLLYVETAEELQAVNDFLQGSDDTGSTYWVGGKYDVSSKKFVWGNGVEIGAVVPWDSGFPDTQVPVTRVSAYNVEGLKLRTQFQTVSNRYICELQVTVSRSNRLKYLGQIKDQKAKIGTNGISTRQTSFYFLSQNAAGFQTAENDCKAFLGDSATLLYIETQEELGNVTEFLASSDDTGSTYWVGGKYDTAKQNFVWLNKAEFGPWAPWDSGMPNTRTAVTRVSAFTAGGLQLRTEFQTVSNRYICELGAGIPEEEPIPCYNDNDLVIVVDSSGSIGLNNYMVALEFTTRLAIAWADNPSNRLSVIIYATGVESVVTLTEKLSVAQLRDRIYNADYLNGGTNSHLGLDAALQQITGNPRSVPKNMVFMTDGSSNDPSATTASAQNVIKAGVRTFSVGIGTSLNPTELLAIAGNKQDHVFNTDGFADLLKLLQPVSLKVCP